MKLTDDEKMAHSNVWHTHRENTESVGQDGNHMVRMSMHRVKKHHKNPGIGTHHLKKPGIVRQMPESPYVQRSSTGTMRVARANLRWRREHARGKE
jgi:hypothetical protein